MELNQSLLLWCNASIADHFSTKLGEKHLHVEGFVRETDSLTEWFELRITGPQGTIITYNQSKMLFTVDLGIVIVNGENGYALQSLIGLGLAAFTNNIPVYRYGPEDDPANDGSYVGELKLTPGTVETTNFDVSPFHPNMRQANLDGTYRLFVDGDNRNGE